MGKLVITDEQLDRFVNRPVAGVIVAVARHTPITPNMLSCMAGLVGLAGGVFLSLGEGVLGACFIMGFLILDCTDGQLARLRGGGGALGRVMDGVGDLTATVAISIGLLLWIYRQTDIVQALAWGVGAGLSLAWTSSLLDRYKRRYLGSVDDVEAMRAEAKASPGLRGALIRAFLPYFVSLGADPVTDRGAYQDRVRVPMILWTWNGPTMHLGVMGVCCVLGRPLEYAMIACVPLNLLAVVTLLLQRRLERRKPAVVS